MNSIRISEPLVGVNIVCYRISFHRRCRWSSGLRRRSAASRLLGMRVQIPLETWISVCCECCLLSGRGLCDGPIPRREVCVCVCVTESDKLQQVQHASLHLQ